ncbi:hypothetical protein F2Q69_00040361 [Brassica cretica]|uniref:Uncharacterized protein n=1 Tax=Brassica cretica TaxID=69181 RepID=A0A8S9NM58_BRACR|nr:hypothetical protein F2Q69_00040361 [Brassica cretica]
MRVRGGFAGEGRSRRAGIAGERGCLRERGGNNDEGRRRVIISEDSDGHVFVSIPSV